MLNLKFGSKSGKEEQNVLYEWWESLEFDNVGRSQLRVCASLLNVYYVPAFHRFRREILSLDKGRGGDDKLAAIAGILSHVKRDRFDKKMAAQMAEGQPKPKIRSIRFKDILSYPNLEEVYWPMCSILGILNGEANIKNLADSIFWWGSDITKKQWLLEYYQNVKTIE
jgi:CRISPR system Cascade subunit CasB